MPRSVRSATVRERVPCFPHVETRSARTDTRLATVALQTEHVETRSTQTDTRLRLRSRFGRNSAGGPPIPTPRFHAVEPRFCARSLAGGLAD